MDPSNNRPSLSYRATGPRGAGQYEVVYGEEVIGKVGRSGLSAGQFGTRWLATTPAGARSHLHLTRDAAAAWLVERAKG